MRPYNVIAEFEKALCDYTGAKYAVAVNSCTAALMLACEWCIGDYRYGGSVPAQIEIPRHTYVSVPMAIIHANDGLQPCIKWRDEAWRGAYQLKPLPVWDCARRFTSAMYVPYQFQCISFAASKILGIEQGGAILHDDDEADPWFRRMRFDGRTEGVDPRDDDFKEVGHHCIMLPSVAAALLVKLYHLPKHNPDLGDYDYPDLSKFEIFR